MSSAAVPLRIGIFGAPVARPLDFVDAFLAGEIDPQRMESEERGSVRVFVVETEHAGARLDLVVAIPPRVAAADAFADVLTEVDAAILVAAAGGLAEQASTLDAFSSACAASPRRVPVVHVMNEFVPPRLASEPEGVAARIGMPLPLRGRICWWRHERCGTEVAREAVARARVLAAR